jgi:hypothetical protein
MVWGSPNKRLQKTLALFSVSTGSDRQSHGVTERSLVSKDLQHGSCLDTQRIGRRNCCAFSIEDRIWDGQRTSVLSQLVGRSVQVGESSGGLGRAKVAFGVISKRHLFKGTQ